MRQVTVPKDVEAAITSDERDVERGIGVQHNVRNSANLKTQQTSKTVHGTPWPCPAATITTPAKENHSGANDEVKVKMAGPHVPQRPLKTTTGPVATSTSTMPPRRASFDSVKYMPSGLDSYQSLIGSKAQFGSGHGHYPPSSYARYGGNPWLERDATIEEVQPARKENTYPPSSSQGNAGQQQSTRPTAATGTTGTTTLPLPKHSSLSRPKAPRHLSLPATSINLLDNHRTLVAAETGQITPRTRQLSLQARSTSEAQTAPEDLRLRTFEINPTSSAAPKTAPLASLPPLGRRASSPDVTPFAQFCRSTPPSPRSEASTPQFPVFDQTSPPQQSRSDIATVGTSAASDPPGFEVPSMLSPSRHKDGLPSPSFEPPRRGSLDLQHADIIRGHGSGFEILKPGTLQPPRLVEREGRPEKQKAAPPISMFNSVPRQRSLSVDGRNRLQKRRPSTDSRRSSSSSRRPSWLNIFAPDASGSPA